MNEKRLVALLWIAKAVLVVVLVYVAVEAAASRLGLLRWFDPGTVSGEPRTTDPQLTSSALRLMLVAEPQVVAGAFSGTCR